MLHFMECNLTCLTGHSSLPATCDDDQFSRIPVHFSCIFFIPHHNQLSNTNADSWYTMWTIWCYNWQSDGCLMNLSIQKKNLFRDRGGILGIYMSSFGKKKLWGYNMWRESETESRWIGVVVGVSLIIAFVVRYGVSHILCVFCSL